MSVCLSVLCLAAQILFAIVIKTAGVYEISYLPMYLLNSITNFIQINQSPFVNFSNKTRKKFSEKHLKNEMNPIHLSETPVHLSECLHTNKQHFGNFQY